MKSREEMGDPPISILAEWWGHLMRWERREVTKNPVWAFEMVIRSFESTLD